MDFKFLSTPKIYFGTNQFQKIGSLIKEYGSRPFIVANISALKKSSDVKITLTEAESEHGYEMSTYIVKGEPTIEMIDKGVEQAKNFKVDVIIGIGGGSALDSCKAIASLITNGGSARDYMEVIGKGVSLTKKPLPIIAIPTTAGTGSEVTKNAVIFSKSDQLKASIRSPLMVPNIAIIDPILMVSLPSNVTATCGMDALTQLIEAYTSNKAYSLTDTLALLGIKNVFSSLLTCFQNGSSLEAREKMAFGALLSGICLANAGLGAVHGFASPLGGLNIPHGTICAALLAPTIEENIQRLTQIDPKNPTLYKFSKLGRLLSKNTTSTLREDYDALIDYLKDLTQKLKIPRLSKYGINEQDFPFIVEKATKSSSMKYNPVSLDHNALIRILRKATLNPPS